MVQWNGLELFIKREHFALGLLVYVYNPTGAGFIGQNATGLFTCSCFKMVSLL